MKIRFTLHPKKNYSKNYDKILQKIIEEKEE